MMTRWKRLAKCSARVEYVFLISGEGRITRPTNHEVEKSMTTIEALIQALKQLNELDLRLKAIGPHLPGDGALKEEDQLSHAGRGITCMMP